jgi:hypothetical protein
VILDENHDKDDQYDSHVKLINIVKGVSFGVEMKEFIVIPRRIYKLHTIDSMIIII